MTEGILFYIFVKYSPLHLLVQLHKHLTQGLVDQGLIKGEKLGIEKEKKNTIIRMLKFGLDDNDISTLSDVPLATVKEIRSQITVD